MNKVQQITKKFFEQNRKKSKTDWKFNPEATGFWVRQYSGLPWLKLNVYVPVDLIYREILQIKQHNYFVDHRSDYNEHESCKSFCIHGKAWDATREDSYYLDNREHNWTTEALNLMPNTVQFFQDSWPTTKFRRIRVMELGPGGIISLHRDELPPGGLDPVNIAITQPLECAFCMEKFGVVPFNSGDAYILNVTNYHAVINDSNQFRYHIIVHHSPLAMETVDPLILSSYNSFHES
jgi:hypothetical protein